MKLSRRRGAGDGCADGRNQPKRGTVHETVPANGRGGRTVERFGRRNTAVEDGRRRPEPDEAPLDDAPAPQPEHGEPRLEDPGVTDLSRRDYVAILKRALKEAN